MTLWTNKTGLQAGLGGKRSRLHWMSEGSMFLQLDPLDHQFDPEDQAPTLWVRTTEPEGQRVLTGWRGCVRGSALSYGAVFGVDSLQLQRRTVSLDTSYYEFRSLRQTGSQ